LLMDASLSLSRRVISVIVWQPSTSEKITNDSWGEFHRFPSLSY
jgi:hypothetical protein